jgi:hypothetical protein
MSHEDETMQHFTEPEAGSPLSSWRGHEDVTCILPCSAQMRPPVKSEFAGISVGHSPGAGLGERRPCPARIEARLHAWSPIEAGKLAHRHGRAFHLE